MRRARLTIGAALLPVALLAGLAGCGGTDSEAGGKAKVVVWTPENRPDDVAAHKELIKDFELANPNVTVEMVVTSWDDHFNRLQAAKAGGTLPDIVYTWQPTTLSLQQQGMLADITDVWNAAGGPSAFPASQAETLAKDGKAFAVPVVGYPHGLWYRKDWFEQAGVKPPTTIDELLAAARATNRDGHNGICLFNKGLDAYYVLDLMLMAGAESFDANGKLAVDSAATRKALQFIKSVNDEKLTPDGWTAWNMDDAKLPFLAGKCAMKIDSTSFTNALNKDNPDLLKKVGFVPLPTDGGKYAGWAGSGQYAVTSGAKNADAAKKFLSFLLEPANYRKFIANEVLGFAPMLTKVAEDPALYSEPRVAPVAEIYRGAGQAAGKGSALIGSTSAGAADVSAKVYNQQVYSEMGSRIAKGESVDSVVAWAAKRMTEITQQ